SEKFPLGTKRLIGLIHTSKVLGSMDLSSSREVSSSRIGTPRKSETAEAHLQACPAALIYFQGW
ncbi:MAG: hypothetical protein VX417_04760, partial [SAR324 cluster bacterium]|nr:hypothetical protein [SAR324 cluster bacterium]